jgi:antitoxin component of MazEF toxin-antitoxin module
MSNITKEKGGKTIIQRIIKTGEDLVVILPENIVESLQLTEGDEVSLSVDSGQSRILIQPVGHSLDLEDIDQEFAAQVSEYIKDYKPALEELSNLEE